MGGVSCCFRWRQEHGFKKEEEFPEGTCFHEGCRWFRFSDDGVLEFRCGLEDPLHGVVVGDVKGFLGWMFEVVPYAASKRGRCWVKLVKEGEARLPLRCYVRIIVSVRVEDKVQVVLFSSMFIFVVVV